VARGIWSGAISFGLINIPVSIMSPKQEERISFRMLDKTDNSPIGYKQYNKATGKDVDRKNIVKGYEYERNQYVIITDEDFKAANPKQTQTIDIQDFIDVHDVDPLLFERPYYLVPGKNGEKGYVLLRQVLERTNRVAIAQFVLRNKQHLVALMARGDYLILEVLRFAHEIKELEEADFLDDVDLDKVRISDKELKMAESLVEGMTGDWDPTKYRDTYQEDLMKRIEAKVKKGDIETAPEVEDRPKSTNTNIVNLMPLLEKSLQVAAKSKGGKRNGHAAHAAARRKKTAKRRSDSHARTHH
jgi:DNA end-binding protein Ku